MHLIIHGGPPRTDTTTIQAAFYRSRKALRQNGIYYHVGPKPMEWSLMMLYSRHKEFLPPELRMHFANAAEARAWSAYCWKQLEARLDADKPEVTLVSSEHFANMVNPSTFLGRLSKRFDRISFFAYARDPVEVYVSEIDQMIRSGVRFADLPQPHLFRYESVANIRNYEAELGAENLIVRNFARKNLEQHDIAVDAFAVLARLIGKELEATEIPEAKNKRLCGAAAAWILSINETFVWTSKEGSDRRAIAERRVLMDRLRNSPALKALPRLSMNDTELELVIRENARPTVQWLNDTYLADQLGIHPGEPSCSRRTPSELSEQLREWLLGYLTPDAVETLSREIVMLQRDEPQGPGAA